MNDADRFVRRWREQHLIETYTDPHICPLCGLALQVVLASPIETSAALTDRIRATTIEQHQQSHGESWSEYQRLGAAPPGGAGGH